MPPLYRVSEYPRLGYPKESPGTPRNPQESERCLAIPCDSLRFLANPCDSWGFPGILGDSWGFLWIPGDSWGILGIPWDSGGFLGIPGDSGGPAGRRAVAQHGSSVHVVLRPAMPFAGSDQHHRCGPGRTPQAHNTPHQNRQCYCKNSEEEENDGAEVTGASVTSTPSLSSTSPWVDTPLQNKGLNNVSRFQS